MPLPSLETLLNRGTRADARAQTGTRIKLLEATVNALTAVVGRMYLKNTFVVLPATLAIKAPGSPTVKSTSAINALVGGLFASKSANTDMAAMAGVLATGKAAAWAFDMGSTGTLTTTTKTADVNTAALAEAAIPAVAANVQRLGYVVVVNTSGGNFTAGTTALDADGIAVTYVNTPAAPALAAGVLDELV